MVPRSLKIKVFEGPDHLMAADTFWLTGPGRLRELGCQTSEFP